MSDSERLDNLDLLRGGAALLVLSGHLRAYIFQSYTEIGHTHLFVKVFYFFTGLGHQAVIIFFALSGFLVGGKALADIVEQRFSWQRYLLRRFTRLWIVIVPALLLTLLLDRLGAWSTGGIGYNGEYYSIYNLGPQPTAGISHSVLTFLGNLAFLQTVYVPIFGSNGPMWSLANEFWYYVVFPIAGWVVFTRGRSFFLKSLGCGILMAIVMLLPIWLIEGGIVWVAGALAAWLTQQQHLTKIFKHRNVRAGILALFALAMVMTKLRPQQIGDVALGLTVALSLPVLAMLPQIAGPFRLLSRGSSEISYTLYLTHFPLLTFIVLTGFAPNRLPPGPVAAAVYIALLGLALAWAGAVWWCFERNTGRVYRFLADHLRPPGISRRIA